MQTTPENSGFLPQLAGAFYSIRKKGKQKRDNWITHPGVDPDLASVLGPYDYQRTALSVCNSLSIWEASCERFGGRTVWLGWVRPGREDPCWLSEAVLIPPGRNKIVRTNGIPIKFYLFNSLEFIAPWWG